MRISSRFAQATHLHMGQWLSLPMILGGLYLCYREEARGAGAAGTGRAGDRQ